ncbi:MAG TPA: FlgD immunoglobulin-like domain containing protein [Candidatus Krumholzibacteria bacterium]|nr:FlgD immunoglobulin-like domain containing protein [Candidatus Krumholzibacteria bacterium]
MRTTSGITAVTCIAAILLSLAPPDALSRNPIRTAFFTAYPAAVGTRLDTLPSNAGHCGVCHFDFDGGGPRNAYGAGVEVAIASGQYANNVAAIQSLENVDADNDGYTSLVEITSALFSNTPTFPGLKSGNEGSTSNVSLAEITPYLTPTGGADTTPPSITVLSPNGGGTYAANATIPVTWTATDASGVESVTLYFSDDGGLSFKPLSFAEANDGTFNWFVPNRPGSQSLIRVVAKDSAGNYGSDWSDATFTITAATGAAPTTFRDMDLPGSQPFASMLEDPDVNCVTCHGNYNTIVEPWSQWKGSMMAQAMRDPLFLACLTVAEQDAPSVGDVCIKCHTPGGWLEGRSVDTSGGLVTEKDREGVQCDFCHRMVDPVYQVGVSPIEDVAVLDSLEAVPPGYANGGFVVDPDPAKRGPYSDAQASHAFLASEFHRSSNLCGTCHDVSNPVFNYDGAPGRYVPNAFDTPHPDGDKRNMFPVERTFSEWTQTDYANGGVFAPQFAGNKPGGIVSTCQDCHMQDVTGAGCNEPGAPTRTDLALHDMTGGNTFVPDIIPTFFPGEVDVAQLQAGKARATNMLRLAASLALATGQTGPNPTLTVTVTNETAHKLPSGYPEGRRIWLNVRGYDENDELVYESGAYDPATGVLTHDADAKIYEIKIGVSERLAPIVGLPAAPSFHFVLNDTVYSDNRIPPRGFTNANFTTVQSPPVAYSYADGQYWDETTYTMPTEVRYAEVKLYYQTTSKEYIEFLRDANVTNTAGLDLYNAWVAQGRNAPVAMVSDVIGIDVVPTGAGGGPPTRTELLPAYPNPFNPTTTIRYSLASRQHVRIDVFDVTGSRVTTLVDESRPAGVQTVTWNGRDTRDEPVASGVYMIRMQTVDQRFVQKAVLLK